jgi:hypothetical protein
MEFGPLGTTYHRPGFDRLNDHTWIIHGADFTPVYRKFPKF